MSNTNTIEHFITSIPKAELHLHIEGTLEPELVLKLAARNRVALPYTNVAELSQAYKFSNLQSFLDVYYQNMQVLLTEQDFFDMTFAYLQHASTCKTRHLEVFFDPQAHQNRGIDFDTVINGIYHALVEGENQFGISFRIIPCFLRDLSVESALDTLDDILHYRDWITAVGLDSAEVGFPPEKFTDVFAKAKANGLLTVAHAGEEGPAEYIWGALDALQASRIDHGIKCVEDKSLIERLYEEQIPLTVCPLSNVKLNIVDNLSQHPLKKMLDSKLCVTINSDDPAYFQSDLVDNYKAVQKAFQLEEADIITLAKNSFIGSFASDGEKKRLLEELDEFCVAETTDELAIA